MHVAFWSSGTDGSSWYRCELPAQALPWRGHSTWASQILPPTQQARADVVVGSRIALQSSLGTWRKLKECGTKLVFDMDDDYFHIDPTHKKIFEFWSDPTMRDGLISAIVAADRCTCASEAQAEVLREYHDDVVVVPNGLHPGLLSAPRDYGPAWDHRPAGHQLTVGWVGTSTTIDALPIIWSMVRPMRTADLRFVAIGVTRDQVRSVGLDPDCIEIEPWCSPGQDYLSRIWEFDIWLAPYRDTPFTRGKFPTKALEAGFLGIPLIASDIRPYREWIKHRVDGFLVRQPRDWALFLALLTSDPNLRERIGIASRAKASNYILGEIGRLWEEVCTF